jgi:predicted DNA-binding transcriptional regulator AlpA
MDESFTINEFCAVEKISRSFFYKLATQGKAPRTYSLGSTRRISGEARKEWRAAREAESAPVAA